MRAQNRPNKLPRAEREMVHAVAMLHPEYRIAKRLGELRQIRREALAEMHELAPDQFANDAIIAKLYWLGMSPNAIAALLQETYAWHINVALKRWRERLE